MIKGIEYTFANGETYTIPPLSLGAIEVMQERLDAFTGDGSLGSVKTVIEATTKALRRNYPDISEEKVANELLDLGNMMEVMQAVMDVGGLRRKAIEAEAEKGGALPGAA